MNLGLVNKERYSSGSLDNTCSYNVNLRYNTNNTYISIPLYESEFKEGISISLMNYMDLEKCEQRFNNYFKEVMNTESEIRLIGVDGCIYVFYKNEETNEYLCSELLLRLSKTETGFIVIKDDIKMEYDSDFEYPKVIRVNEKEVINYFKTTEGIKIKNNHKEEALIKKTGLVYTGIEITKIGLNNEVIRKKVEFVNENNLIKEIKIYIENTLEKELVINYNPTNRIHEVINKTNNIRLWIWDNLDEVRIYKGSYNLRSEVPFYDINGYEKIEKMNNYTKLTKEEKWFEVFYNNGLPNYEIDSLGNIVSYDYVNGMLVNVKKGKLGFKNNLCKVEDLSNELYDLEDEYPTYSNSEKEIRFEEGKTISTVINLSGTKKDKYTVSFLAKGSGCLTLKGIFFGSNNYSQTVELTNERRHYLLEIAPEGDYTGFILGFENSGSLCLSYLTVRKGSSNIVEYEYDNEYKTVTKVNKKIDKQIIYDNDKIKAIYYDDNLGSSCKYNEDKIESVSESFGYNTSYKYENEKLTEEVIKNRASDKKIKRRYEYNEFLSKERVYKTINEDLSEVITEYNNKYLLTNIISQNRKLTYSYDDLRRLINTRFNDNELDNIGYVYDSFGRISRVVLADGSYYEYLYEYNENGYLEHLSISYNNKVVEGYSYDEYGRVIYKEDSEYNHCYSYEYNGDLISEIMLDDELLVTYVYDEYKSLEKIIDHKNGIEYINESNINEGKLVEKRDDSSLEVKYILDENGRLEYKEKTFKEYDIQDITKENGYDLGKRKVKSVETLNQKLNKIEGLDACLFIESENKLGDLVPTNNVSNTVLEGTNLPVLSQGQITYEMDDKLAFDGIFMFMYGKGLNNELMNIEISPCLYEYKLRVNSLGKLEIISEDEILYTTTLSIDEKDHFIGMKVDYSLKTTKLNFGIYVDEKMETYSTDELDFRIVKNITKIGYYSNNNVNLIGVINDNVVLYQKLDYVRLLCEDYLTYEKENDKQLEPYVKGINHIKYEGLKKVLDNELIYKVYPLMTNYKSILSKDELKITDEYGLENEELCFDYDYEYNGYVSKILKRMETKETSKNVGRVSFDVKIDKVVGNSGLFTNGYYSLNLVEVDSTKYEVRLNGESIELEYGKWYKVEVLSDEKGTHVLKANKKEKTVVIEFSEEENPKYIISNNNYNIKGHISNLVITEGDILNIDIVKASKRYDELKRLSKRIVKVNDEEVIRNEYKYKKVNEYETYEVVEEDIKYNNIVNNRKYDYNINNNTLEIKEDDVLKVKYTFNNHNEIIKEEKGSNVTNYIYDKCGNITNKNNKEYEYDEYKRLIRVKEGSTNIYEIEYDGLLPIRINDDKLEYQGNRIVTYGTNSYKYNYEGKRIEKLTEEDHIKYYYEDNNLVYERRLEEDINYLYDEENNLYGFKYNNNYYYYVRDVYLNIIGIINENGLLVGKYEYDAYGNHSITLNTNNIASINPFRYKGYYYDVETGLFWCNSRYYSPELCRWISPDSIEYLDPESINGLNLYCYANNNPIGTAYKSSSVGVSVANRSINQNFSLLMVPNLGINKNNYSSSLHWKSKWLVTSWPSFLVFSNEKAALLDWGLSIYKGSLYFDESENHSIYIGVGNVTAFAGYDVEKERIGVFADVYLFNVGYDESYIDAGISFIGMGFIFGIENKKLKIKLDPPGTPGIEISIDFGQIIKDIFGWEW